MGSHKNWFKFKIKFKFAFSSKTWICTKLIECCGNQSVSERFRVFDIISIKTGPVITVTEPVVLTLTFELDMNFWL